MKSKISHFQKAAVFISVLFMTVFFASPTMAATAYTRLNPLWGYTIVHQVVVQNTTVNPIHNIDLKVPLAANTNISWQDFAGEEFFPKPDKIITNVDGTRIAQYHIDVLPAKSTKTFQQSFGINNYSIRFEIDAWEHESISNKVNKKYLASESGIDIQDRAIVNYAKSVANDSTNPYIIAKRLFADINLFMTYEDIPNVEHSASKAVRAARGNCVDYTFLYVACLRSLGIPARWHTGYTYAVDEHSAYPYLQQDGTLNGNLLRHTWAEFYLENTGWVVADPTFTYMANINGREEKLVDWSRFANIGRANHLLWVSEGGAAVDDVKYTYVGSAPNVSFNSSIKLNMDISQYQDLAGHWAKESVNYLTKLKPPVVVGMSENYYGVNESITRAQFITMVNRALKHSNAYIAIPRQTTIVYKDVPKNHWAYSEICEAGYMSGYPDETFRPNAQITRGEMAAVLARLLPLPAYKGAPVFKDLEQTGYKWCVPSVMQLYQAGLAAGITKTEFVPQKPLRRGEAAVFIARWLIHYNK